MLKRTFIPKEYRPVIKGSVIQEKNKPSRRKKQCEMLPSLLPDTPHFTHDTVHQYFYFGPKDDKHFTLLTHNIPQTYYFDDYDNKWNFSYNSKTGASIHDLITKKKLVIPHDACIYVRYPSSSKKDFIKTFRIFELILSSQCISYCEKNHLFSSKPLQLIYFPSNSSCTIVTNNRQKIKNRSHWICKSISNVRSKVTLVKDFYKTRKQINIPILIQEKIFGIEHKAHFLFHKNKLRHLMDTTIVSKELDYRHGSIKPKLDPFYKTPQIISSIARKFHHEFNLNLLDIDYFITEKNNIEILEVNSSPAFSYIAQESHQRDTMGTVLSELRNPVIVLGCKNDYTFHYFKTITDHSKKQRAVHYFYYDDIFSKWSYKFENGKLYFLKDKIILSPRAIYNRGANIQKNARWCDPIKILSAILNFSQETVFPKPSEQFRNSSKPYQQITSLRGNENAHNASLYTPETFVLNHFSQRKLSYSKIVKSISGTRSIVVDENTYSHWNSSYIQNIPVQFQKKINGTNIRVHVIDNKVFAHKVISENQVDYRYAHPTYEEYKLPVSIQKECIALRKKEGLRLAGIDLLLKGRRYYCLEINPCPAWAHFSDKNHNITFQIGKELSRVLCA